MPKALKVLSDGGLEPGCVLYTLNNLAVADDEGRGNACHVIGSYRLGIHAIGVKDGDPRQILGSLAPSNIVII